MKIWRYFSSDEIWPDSTEMKFNFQRLLPKYIEVATPNWKKLYNNHENRNNLVMVNQYVRISKPHKLMDFYVYESNILIIQLKTKEKKTGDSHHKHFCISIFIYFIFLFQHLEKHLCSIIRSWKQQLSSRAAFSAPFSFSWRTSQTWRKSCGITHTFFYVISAIQHWWTSCLMQGLASAILNIYWFWIYILF